MNLSHKKLKISNRKKRFIFYSSPEYWFQTALELNEAVKELYEQRDKSHYYQNYHFENKKTIKRSVYSRAVYLLMSYTLENLLKGIAVLHNSGYVNNGKIQGKIKTHDLNSLSELNGFKLEQKQIHFQSILSTQCVSNARYPLGLNENIELTDPIITMDDYHEYLILYEKYKEYLSVNYNLLGWDSGVNDPDLNTKPGEFNYGKLQ